MRWNTDALFQRIGRQMGWDRDALFRDIEIDAEKLAKLRRKPRAEKTLAIHFTPRSGSSWLTDIIAQSGALGAAREFFNPKRLPKMAQALGARDLDSYIDLLGRRFGAGGVFSFEITAHQLRAVFPDTDTFIAHFGAVPAVWLIRRDIVAQAVSLAKMVSTSVSHTPLASTDSRAAAEAAFAYDAALIRRWLTHILVAERESEALFAAHAIRPLRLSYEGIMAAGADATLAQLAAHIGVAALPPTPPEPRHSKLGTSLNADYAARFRREEVALLKRVEAERAPWLAQLSPPA